MDIWSRKRGEWRRRCWFTRAPACDWLLRPGSGLLQSCGSRSSPTHSGWGGGICLAWVVPWRLVLPARIRPLPRIATISLPAPCQLLARAERLGPLLQQPLPALALRSAQQTSRQASASAPVPAPGEPPDFAAGERDVEQSADGLEAEALDET
jgi:hypothetical protein